MSFLVAFDFGGTLDGTGIPPRERRWQYYQRAGYSFSRDSLLAAHRETRTRIAADPSARHMHLAQSARLWFEIEASILGVDQVGVAEWASEFIADEVDRLHQARDVLAALSSRHVLAVISNNIGNLATVLDDAGVAEYLSVIVDSTICGYRKPDPRIFSHCAEQAQFDDPSQCWFLGDNWEKDILAAKGAGWRPVYFCPDSRREPSDLDVPRVAMRRDVCARQARSVPWYRHRH